MRPRRLRRALRAGAAASVAAAGAIVFLVLPAAEPEPTGVTVRPPTLTAGVLVQTTPPADVPWGRPLRPRLFDEPAPAPPAEPIRRSPPPPPAVQPPAVQPPAVQPPPVLLLGTISEDGSRKAILRVGRGAAAGVEVRAAGEELKNLPGVIVTRISDRVVDLAAGGRTFRVAAERPASPFEL